MRMQCQKSDLSSAGEKPVGDITAADIKNLLNYWMNKGYAYTTVKKVYVVLNEYFRYLYREELIPKNPMANIEMMKKSNFLSAQSRENLPQCETVTILRQGSATSPMYLRYERKDLLSFGSGGQNYTAENKESSDKALSELDILMLF